DYLFPFGKYQAGTESGKTSFPELRRFLSAWFYIPEFLCSVHCAHRLSNKTCRVKPLEMASPDGCKSCFRQRILSPCGQSCAPKIWQRPVQGEFRQTYNHSFPPPALFWSLPATTDKATDKG